ncbi:hypothetical protein PHMEG_00012624 [Phytophthora megakarya]|uniref:Uncharacterized protein n=1 Tax=Phytophthora megakarya TaxID=4795 RepID=A0A225WAC6_9STRA|nr:hypothetical protein PHMEG_00012624 [Phytophthora megakarya]
MEAMRRLCSEIGFVNEVSITSLADDLLRLRSKHVEQIGLMQTRNPANGHGQIIVLYFDNYLTLINHIASRGGSVVDVIRIMMRSLSGASTASQI